MKINKKDEDTKRPKASSKPKKRFTLHEKYQAIKLARQEGITRASILLNINKKNIYRWMNKGFFSKKGRGRKISNPDLEEKIIERVLNYIKLNKDLPAPIFIRKEAKKHASEGFRASKGWYEKFMKRNKTKFLTFLYSVKE